MPQKNPATVFALLLLSACMLVDDFGARWEEAAPDPCINPIATAIYEEAFRREITSTDAEKLARALMIDGKPYLLLKKSAQENGGRLYRFDVKNGIFTRLRPKPEMRQAFEAETASILPSLAERGIRLRHDTLQIKKLTAESEAVITAYAAKADYWEAEDKTLYNPLRDPTCRFEDRNLAALDAPPTRKKPSPAKHKKKKKPTPRIEETD